MSEKKYTRLILFVFVLTMPVYYYSCTNDIMAPYPCFQDNVLPIFVSKCTYSGCHNSQDHASGYDLSNYDGILKGVVLGKPNKSEVYSQIHSGEMPPSSNSQLTRIEKQIIKNWIKMKAPNSSNCNNCDTSFTYKDRIAPLMDKWCVSCHSAGNAGGGYDFTNYKGVALAADNNRLSGSVNQQPGYSAMPKSAGKISDCDLQAIGKWLSAGHPDN